MIRLKIEFSGLLNGKLPNVNQVIEVEAFDYKSTDIILKSILHGICCQGFILNTDIVSLVLSSLQTSLSTGKLGDKYKKLADINEQFSTIRVYCKRV